MLKAYVLHDKIYTRVFSTDGKKSRCLKKYVSPIKYFSKGKNTLANEQACKLKRAPD